VTDIEKEMAEMAGGLEREFARSIMLAMAQAYVFDKMARQMLDDGTPPEAAKESFGIIIQQIADGAIGNREQKIAEAKAALEASGEGYLYGLMAMSVAGMSLDEAFAKDFDVRVMAGEKAVATLRAIADGVVDREWRRRSEAK
jgi:hypothetical protein